MKKIRVALLCGGKSPEHEVSLLSAKSVLEAINRQKYEIVLLGIDRQGKWWLQEESRFLEEKTDVEKISLPVVSTPMAIERCQKGEIDVVFPLLHGTFGEDGTMQGLLKLLNLPFVGASVLGSAVGMDKEVMKRLLLQAGLPVPRFIILKSHQRPISFEEAVETLGLPLFVKPTNMGSSMGISKVKTKEDWQRALELAFRFDRKILIEEAIDGRELECAVLGNDHPEASLVGELFAQDEYYTYQAKYQENGVFFQIPAAVPSLVAEQLRAMALKAFEVLCCEGMARVDFFLQRDHTLLLNELNTIPGFTKMSMYPKLWEASGLSYEALIDRLIELAIERFEKEALLA